MCVWGTSLFEEIFNQKNDDNLNKNDDDFIIDYQEMCQGTRTVDILT